MVWSPLEMLKVTVAGLSTLSKAGVSQVISVFDT
jgi:hypothetical protein